MPIKNSSQGTWVALSVKLLPLALVMIPGLSQHRASHSAGSLILPLPKPLLMLSHTISFSLSINKKMNKVKLHLD